MPRKGLATIDIADARRILERVIAARQAYADHLRAVANGQTVDDPEFRKRLKAECAATLFAWQRLQTAWRHPAPEQPEQFESRLHN